jgi:aminoglycoside phosphotransferase (APT) family kinase protein
LRAWHDATVDFAPPDADWGLPQSGPREVICHNDFAPYNCIFSNGRLVGAIDFDLCSPGARLWDLAYTAYRFVPLLPEAGTGDMIPGEKSPFEAPVMAERLELLLATYGAAGGLERYRRSDLIQTTIDRLDAIAAWTEEHVRKHGVAALADHPAMYRAHARWLGTGRESRG